VATSIGLGPFAVLLENDLRAAITGLQLFLMTRAAAGLFVSRQSADWQVSARVLVESERERDAEGRQVSRIIYRNARQLSDVIEDVLELSQLTTTTVSTRPAVEIDARLLLCGRAEDATGLLAPGRDVQVDSRVPDYGVLIQGVEQDLTWVCANLPEHVIKLSPAGGTGTVTLADLGGTLELCIADEGPGIPVAEQDAVWEGLYRGKSDQHRNVPGTGLGLPIVRTLVRQSMGGDVAAILTSYTARPWSCGVRTRHQPRNNQPKRSISL